MSDEVTALRTRVLDFLREAHDHDNLVGFDLPATGVVAFMVVAQELREQLDMTFDDALGETAMGPFVMGRVLVARPAQRSLDLGEEHGRVVRFRFHLRKAAP